MRIKDLSGKRFGKLVVVRLAGTSSQRQSLWECSCDCGTTKIISSNHLSRSNSPVTSCGCKIHERKLPDTSLRELYGQYKRQAKNRNYEFSLSLDEFAHLTSLDCHYCGESPQGKYRRKRFSIPYTYNGIDRMNNDLGYSQENCVPCCKRCNRAKNEMSYNEFLSWINILHKRFFANTPKTSI